MTEGNESPGEMLSVFLIIDYFCGQEGSTLPRLTHLAQRRRNVEMVLNDSGAIWSTEVVPSVLSQPPEPFSLSAHAKKTTWLYLCIYDDATHPVNAD